MTSPPQPSSPRKQLVTSDSEIRVEEKKIKKNEAFFVIRVRVGTETWHLMRQIPQIVSLRQMLQDKYSGFMEIPEILPNHSFDFFSLKWISSSVSEEQQAEDEKKHLQEFFHFVFQSELLRNDRATLNFIKPIRELMENTEHLEITIRSVKYAHNNFLDPFKPSDVLEPSIYIDELPETGDKPHEAVSSPTRPRRGTAGKYTDEDIARLRGIMKTMSSEKISRRKRTESQENLLAVTRAKLYAAVGAPE